MKFSLVLWLSVLCSAFASSEKNKVEHCWKTPASGVICKADKDLTAKDRTTLEEISKKVSGEIRKFVGRANSCAHWLSEEGNSEERRQQIREAVHELHCDQIETDRSNLLKNHLGDEKIISKIKEAGHDVE